MHYPTDIEAGRRAGTAMAALMFSDPQFKADFLVAKAEVRADLGMQPAGAAWTENEDGRNGRPSPGEGVCLRPATCSRLVPWLPSAPGLSRATCTPSSSALQRQAAGWPQRVPPSRGEGVPGPSAGARCRQRTFAKPAGIGPARNQSLATAGLNQGTWILPLSPVSCFASRCRSSRRWWRWPSASLIERRFAAVPGERPDGLQNIKVWLSALLVQSLVLPALGGADDAGGQRCRRRPDRAARQRLRPDHRHRRLPGGDGFRRVGVPSRSSTAIPFMWAMHSLHHSDTTFDATTAVRHFG